MFGFDWHIIEAFFLVFIRTGTAVALMPVFGYPTVPAPVKAGLSFAIALVLAPLASQHLSPLPPGVLPMATAAMSEALVGIVFGLVTSLVLIGAQFAGAILGVQIGLSIVNVVDPQFEEQGSIIGELNYLVALIIFLALNIHHHFLMALGDSFKLIPLGGAVFPGELATSYARLSAEMFVIAVKLAAPVMAMVLLTEIALAFMARMMPQMNVFIVGYPVRIAMGLFGLAVSWPLFQFVLSKYFTQFEGGLSKMIALMAGR